MIGALWCSVLWVLRRVFQSGGRNGSIRYGQGATWPASLSEHICEQRVGGQAAFREVAAEKVSDDVEKIER